MILILKSGTTYPSIKNTYKDFEDWIIDKMGLIVDQFIVHETRDYSSLPPSIEYSGIVITGSHDMVTDLELKNTSLSNWLLEVQDAGTPLLGICFGHQLLCVLNGGTVGYNTSGIEIGSLDVYLTDAGKSDKLLGCLPPVFKGFKTHQQSICIPPVQAEILATSYSGIIDAFKIGENAWGVQFHPEFDQDILRAYIDIKSKELEEKSLEVEAELGALVNIDSGSQLLAQFKKIIHST